MFGIKTLGSAIKGVGKVIGQGVNFVKNHPELIADVTDAAALSGYFPKMGTKAVLLGNQLSEHLQRDKDAQELAEANKRTEEALANAKGAGNSTKGAANNFKGAYHQASQGNYGHAAQHLQTAFGHAHSAVSHGHALAKHLFR